MSWNHIVVEGFCFGDSNDKVHPCGKTRLDSGCFGNRNICPHLGYSASNEREAAFFVPTRHILGDKLRSITESVKEFFVWNFWDSLWFNRRKTQEFLDSIGTHHEDKEVRKIFKDIDHREKLENRRFRRWIKNNPEGRSRVEDE